MRMHYTWIAGDINFLPWTCSGPWRAAGWSPFPRSRQEGCKGVGGGGCWEERVSVWCARVHRREVPDGGRGRQRRRGYRTVAGDRKPRWREEDGRRRRRRRERGEQNRGLPVSLPAHVQPRASSLSRAFYTHAVPRSLGDFDEWTRRILREKMSRRDSFNRHTCGEYRVGEWKVGE